MPPKSPDQPTPQKQPLERYERLKMIFEALISYPPANSAIEAHNLLSQAFKSIEENPEYVIPDRGMITDKFYVEGAVLYDERKIYYEPYPRHMVFIADNGAISIYQRGGVDISKAADVQRIKNLLPCELSKPGADGKDVWGN